LTFLSAKADKVFITMLQLGVEEWLLAAVLLTGMGLSVFLRKLTPVGALTGGALALFIYLGAGFTGIALMTVFFILGTLATSHRIQVKQALKAAEKSGGRRDAVQVLSNAGIPAVFGLLAFTFPQQAETFRLLLATAFSSATADTLSSELGTVYGKKFYNIITFKPDRRGLDGVVSIEGTLFGILGSVMISFIYCLGYGGSLAFLWIIIGGTIGNIADSLLGATLQRRRLLNNNGVNLLNTLLAALAALLLFTLE
jgi:uncharacterized protein (TIGR00297 family)